MKHISILSLLILAVISILATGCSNKEASKESQAQALLVQAISYADGNAPSQAARDAALKLAASKKFKPSDNGNGPGESEIVMIAGRLLCDQILAEYPATPAAVKAAELKQQINQRLRVISEQRNRSMFNDSN
jgi:hypothetical protein